MNYALTHVQRCALAEKIRQVTMTYLYERTDIERVEVLRASTDAANEHGRILALTHLPFHSKKWELYT